MTRIREGKIKYKITDNLYIYNNGKVDFLVYLNIAFKDTNNIAIYKIEEVINRGRYCEYILNMNDVENSVSKPIKSYIETLKKKVPEELDIIALYIFLLKLKFYINHIRDALLAKELYDQYNKIKNDNNFIYTMVDYLLDKRKTEQILQKWKSILKDINAFSELYYTVHYTENYDEDYGKDFILRNYDKFKETLANILKAYQNTNTNTTNQ